MDIGRITAGEIKAALERIRQARPIGENPLLAMDLLRVRLRAEGIADGPESREWALQGLLHRRVSRRLAALRGDEAGGRPGDRGPTSSPASAITAKATSSPPAPPASPAPRPGGAEAEREALAADFAAGDIEREAWSALYHRYLAERPLQMREIAAIALPGGKGRSAERQVHRRMSRALKALEGRLRDEEAAAARERARMPGAHPRERVQLRPEGELDAEGVGEPQGGTDAGGATPAEAALLAALRDEERVVELAPEELERIAARPASDLQAWRLSRVAAWSRPRYRLDERFVSLTLLLDRGEEAATERWHAAGERRADLAAALAEAGGPAAVLLGPPGSGKSTLLRRLELDTAIAGLRGEGERVSFLLPLSLYPARGEGGRPAPPGDWLAETWAARNPDLPAFDALLAEGRLLLLLDGLNEMPCADAAGFRAAVGAWRGFLQGLAQRSPGSRALLSCRSLDYSAPLSSPALRVPQLRVEPLSDEQVAAFLRRYRPRDGAALWARLRGSPQLEVLRSPYFLRLLLEQAGDEAALDLGRAGLFTGFLRAALRREIERGHPLFEPDGLLAERDYRRLLQARTWRSPYELPDRGALLPGLEALALGMQERGARSEMGRIRVGYDRALALLEPAPAASVLEAGQALGVLDEDAGRDEILFVHQLLQEYFAARALARAPRPELLARPWRAAEIEPSTEALQASLGPADRLPALAGSGWEETARLAAEMAEAPEAYLRGLMATRLALAGDCAAEPALRARLPAPLLAELRAALVARSRDPEADLRARIEAGLALGRLGDPRLPEARGPEGSAYLAPAMAEISAGSYPIGRDDPGRPDHPRHERRVEAFALGRFPVTVSEYARFLDADGYEDERWWRTEAARRWRRGETTAEGPRASYRRWRRAFRDRPEALDAYRDAGQMAEDVHARWTALVAMDDEAWEAALAARWPAGPLRAPSYWRRPGYDNPAQPVAGLSWYEARAYCAWLSAQSGRAYRLPTELEWEAAARGPEGRRYAYGNRFDPLKANVVQTRVRRTTPVGVFPGGDTPEGLSDLSGNVSEWTASLYGPYGERERPELRFAYPYEPEDGREDPEAPAEICRVHRGGAWDHPLDHLDACERGPFRPDIRHDLVGFRLAADPG